MQITVFYIENWEKLYFEMGSFKNILPIENNNSDCYAIVSLQKYIKF